ncbi:trichoplein keratin filament-binding protein [Scaptodrosophila lebanonensis]|uniref:Trichoplein keratin filament-binding protein n=1 Tax=Drosophila lebanonensis TaxID=7225 RepID=A0A6J2T9D1_DROLE|nr:trichoplein keratin filament-binding protein [Scaptodrosophila lebanonensis]
MSVPLNYQHAQYAMRRELEHNRVQAVEERNRYYDHWGKVTTRFDSWTNKEYYNNAEKKIQQKQSLEEKQRQLAERRSKLRSMLDSENDCYDCEMGRKGRSRQTNNLETLTRVNQSLKEREQLKRKLELEAKLYGRWRHGVDDDKLLYQSKSDNQVLAKLNWLDKQIEQQQQREQEEALATERQLQLQQERSRTELAQKERQLIREQEIKEIRALQEKHMSELKRRQEQSDKLKEEERHLRVFLEELKKELQLIEQSTALVLQRPDFGQAFNLKKIKVFVRNRSETYRKQIALCINLLQRVKNYSTKPEAVQQLIGKYKAQQDAEISASAQIDTMYESEAKYNLQRCEETWREQNLQRYGEIKKLIEAENNALSALLTENMTQQQEIIELRSTHLTGIENSNKQLEQLTQEAAASPRATSSGESIPQTAVEPETELLIQPSNSCIELANAELPPKLTNSFSNLNLDCWQNLPSVRGGIDVESTRLNKTRSMNVVNPTNAVPPKFARKRVAWT